MYLICSDSGICMHRSEQRHLDLEIAEQTKHRGLKFGKRKVSFNLFFFVSALFDLLFCISLPVSVCSMYVCMDVCMYTTTVSMRCMRYMVQLGARAARACFWGERGMRGPYIYHIFGPLMSRMTQIFHRASIVQRAVKRSFTL